MPVESSEEKLRVLRALSDHLIKGRWQEVRSPSPSELKRGPSKVEHDLGGSSGPPSMSRAELGIHGLKTGGATCLEKSEKRGVQAASNAPSEDRKCCQRVELGIHGLNRWTIKC